MNLQPGTLVTANVRLERPLAQGAMGSVWLAEHLTLNTQVAVKFISDRLDPDSPEVLERFVREASAAAQIRSSHVVQTFDQGVMRDGTPYIVMEYLDGEGLGQRLARVGTISLSDTYRIVQQTAKALGSAHKAGIIHRDIKPDNVFLSMRDDELHVKIFDFGIAKHRRMTSEPPPPIGAVGPRSEARLGLTNDGVMMGTPEYMSPEQVMSASHVDHRADLWALAAVAYVSLTGRLPFEGEDVGALCVELLEARFVPPTQLRYDLPPALDTWFERAFAKSMEARFQSAREMAQALTMAIPSASLPEGRLSLARQSNPSLPAYQSLPRQASTGPEILSPVTGGPTFSGAARDAAGSGRLSPSMVWALVMAGLALVGGIALMTAVWSEPEPQQLEPRPAAAPLPSFDSGEASEEEHQALDPATTATTATELPATKPPPPPTTASASPPLKPPAPRQLPKPRPARKNPGF